MTLIKYHGANEAVYTFDPDDPKQFSLESFRRLVKNGTFTIVDGDVDDTATSVTDEDDSDAAPDDGQPTGESGDEDEGPSKDELLARAEELGVEVDKRWGVARIQAAIDEG